MDQFKTNLLNLERKVKILLAEYKSVKDELVLEFNGVPQKVLFHGHCHQKALAGTDSSVAALRLPPGFH